MGKLTERDIVEFAVDLTNRLFNIDKEYFDELSQDWIFRWENYFVTLGDIHDWEWTAETLLKFSAGAKVDPDEPNVKEFTDNEHCVAYLVIEGDLYGKMYNYEGYGEGGEEAKKYLEALNTAVDSHNMRYDWAGGAIKLYDINDPDAGIIK